MLWRLLRKLSETLKRIVVAESVYLGETKLAVPLEQEKPAWKWLRGRRVRRGEENNVKSLAKPHKALYALQAIPR